MGLQSKFLAPEHRAQARADDYEPERLDREADALLRADAIAGGFVPGEDGNSLRTYQRVHGLATVPREREIGIESADATIPRRSDLLYVFMPFPKPPPSASHRSVCTACRRRRHAAYNSIETPRARWRDEIGHLEQVADSTANHKPEGDFADEAEAWRFLQSQPRKRRKPVARVARAIARESLTPDVIERLEDEVPHFELVERWADGFSLRFIALDEGVSYSTIQRRYHRAREAALAVLAAGTAA